MTWMLGQTVDHFGSLGANTSAAADASTPQESLLIPHPREVFRTATVDPAVVEIVTAGGKAQAADSVAALYCSATPHRNLAKHSNDLLDAYWTATNTTKAEATSSPIAIEGMAKSPYLLATGTGLHFVESEVYALPRSQADWILTLSVYILRKDGTANAALQILDSTATDHGRTRFNLDSGTVVGSDTNNATVLAAAVSPVTGIVGGDTWYRCSLKVQFSNALSGFKLRLYVTDASDLLSYAAGSESAYFAGVMWESGGDGATPTAWVDTDEDTGAWWRVHSTDVNRTTDWDGVTGWTPWVPADYAIDWARWKAERGWTHNVRRYSQAYPYLGDLQVEIYDPDADYVELANVLAGQRFEPSRSIETGYSVQWMEMGGEDEGYRPVFARRRQLVGTLSWLEQAEADELDQLDREFGRSEPVLVVLQDDSARSLARQVYGFIDQSPLLHRTWSSSAQCNVFQKNLQLEEAIPDSVGGGGV